MFDAFGRKIRYLRISVTNRCNLRCRYCMPDGAVHLTPPENVLTDDEIERIARVAVSLGTDSIRITGGEPLLRPGIVELTERLAKISGLQDLSLTTNGVLLQELAQPLKAVGLKRVNISLDTLDPERFRQLTGGEIQQTLTGLQSALDAHLDPVKVNVVLFGKNGDEPVESDIVNFAELSREQPVHIRFIEWMPVNAESRQISASRLERVKDIIFGLSAIEEYSGPFGFGPAKYYRYPDAAGSIGFITPFSAPFCSECSRLRLTHTGALKLCLFHHAEIDLREPLRSGATDAEIAELFQAAVRNKPPDHSVGLAGPGNMRQIGG